MDQMKVMKIHDQEDEAEGTDHRNKDEGVTANTAEAISSVSHLRSLACCQL